ncbi:hypothetical protein AX16_006315 [Volvariella volvacea WC 439]|nr:hypothetical protein AX16_006315 [Volvariella volvacea WC 439]
MPPQDRKARIADIEAEIESLNRKLIRLRRRRNALLPISTLPSELIAKVLQHMVDDTVVAVERHSETEGPFKGVPRSVYDWTSVTQFCAEWRVMALGQPTLWTRIWTTNLGWLKAHLERSKDQPLHIDTWGRARDAHHDEMLRLVIANMHRIHSLRIDAAFLRTSVLRFQNVPAPQLEILRCVGSVPDNIRCLSSSIPPSNMPKLRHLQLELCSSQDWNCILPAHLPTVTSVSLVSITSNDQLNILERCTAVRRLSTNGGWTKLTEPRKLTLPNLEYLSYSHTRSSLLDCLPLPPRSFLDIDGFTDDQVASSIFSRFSRALDRFTPSVFGRNAQLHHVEISHDEWRLVVHAKDRDGDDLAAFAIQADLHRDQPLLFGSILEFCQGAGVGIQSMRVNSARHCLTLFFAFCHHPHISTIHIQTFSALKSLLSFSDARSPACTGMPLYPGTTARRIRHWCGCKHCHDKRVSSYPGLQTLIVYLDSIDIYEEVSLEEGTMGPSSKMFLGWLGGRRQKGLGLRNLEIHYDRTKNIKGFDTLITKLQQVVDNVTVQSH